MPGWTLPGVVTAGGVTALVKAQRVLPGRRVLLAGTGPLLLAAATALVHGGAHVVGIAEAAPRRALLGLLRRPGRRGPDPRGHASALADPDVDPDWPRPDRGHGGRRARGHRAARRDWRPVTGTRAHARRRHGRPRLRAWSPRRSWPTSRAARSRTTPAAAAGSPSPIPSASWRRRRPASSSRATAPASPAPTSPSRRGVWPASAPRCTWDGSIRPGRRSGAAPALRALRRFAAFRRTLGRVLAPRPGLYELATDDTIVCRCEEVSGAEIRVAIEEGAHR